MRYASHYTRVRTAADPVAEIRRLADEEVISALAAASREQDPYLANVLATEAMNRTRQNSIVAHTLGEGVFAVDTRGRVTFANRAALQFMRAKAGDLVGRTVREGIYGLPAEGDPPSDACPIMGVLRSGRTVHRDEDAFRRLDGVPLPVSFTASPIMNEGEVSGVVVVFRDITERKRAEAERAELLAREQAAREKAEAAERRTRFLAEAGAILAGTLEYESTLSAVGRLAVPFLADWCIIDLVDDDGEVTRVDVTHANPADARIADAVRRLPPRGIAQARSAIAEVLRTGRALRVPEVTDTWIRENSGSEARRRAVAAMNLRSLMIVPLVARGRTLGAIFLGTAGSGRTYEDADLTFATELARRAAFAVDNARLYQAAVRGSDVDVADTRYRVLTENATDLITLHAPDGMILYASPTCHALLGYAPEELAGRDVRERVHPEDREELARAAAAADGSTRLALYRVRHRNGAYRWFESTYRRLACTVDGEDRVLAVSRDVTERRETETHIRRRETQLAEAQGIARIGSWEWDITEERVTWSDEMHRLFGIPVGAFPGTYEGWRALIPEGERERVTGLVNAAVSDGRVLDFEHRIITPDGEERVLHCRAEVFRDARGNPTRLVGTAQDVTTRKRAEDALKGSVTLFTATLDAARDGLLVVDNRGHVTHHNRRLLELLRPPDTTLTGVPAADVFRRVRDMLDDPDDAEARLAEAVARTEEDLEGVLTFQDGRILEWYRRPQRIGADIVGHVWGFRDVTAHWLAERELRAHRDRLESLMRELARANRELEAFSYSVSHDLRAPLRGIEYLSQALLEDHGDGLAPQGRRHLIRLREESQRLMDLVTDLLTFSRVGQGALEDRRVDLSLLARDVLDELAGQDPGRRVSVHVQPGLMARGDARLLRVALENLLGNAWKFTERTGDAEITFGEDKIDGERVFFVADNGAGFDPRQADRLFTPFQRLHARHEFEGTGVGLATVHRIVKRHGGRVWAEGRPEEGATFRFTLP